MSSESRFEVTVTGVPLWLLREYLEELGGQADGGGTVRGNDWSARLTQVDDYLVGSLRVGRVHLELRGSPGAVARLRPSLEKKLLRAGG